MATKPKKSTNHFVRVEPDQAIDLSSVLQGIRSQPGQAPADPVEEPGMFRSLADSGLALGSGAVTGVKMVTDAFGADNSASQFLGDTVQGMQSLYSPHRQAELARRAQLIKAAEESGSTWEEIKAYGGSLVEAPVDTLLNAAGTMVPTAASMLIPGAREANVARLLGAGMGAVQGAGAGKSSIYDATLERALAEGRSPDEAKALATEAQAYGGENTDLIAANAGLGVLAGSSGVERALHALKFGRQGAASAPSLLRRTGTGALAEGVPEGFQGGVEQLSGNVALQRQGYEDVPTMRGVLGSGALEMAAGGGLGAAAAIPSQADPAPPPIVPPSGPLSRAANAGAAAAPPAPQPVALDQSQQQALLDLANRRAREIEEKANGTKEQKVTGLDGKTVTIPGKQPEFLTPAEKEEREFLQANGGDAQALAKAYQIPAAPADEAAPALSGNLAGLDEQAAEPAPVEPPAAPANTFASLDEADAYVDGQMKMNSAAAGVPVENEDGTIALVPKSDPRHTQAVKDRLARKKARRAAAKTTEPSNDLAGEAAQPGPADAGAVPGTERMGGEPADLGAMPGPDAPIAAGDVRNGGDAAGTGRGQRNDALTPSMLAAGAKAKPQPTTLGAQPIQAQPAGTRGTTADDVLGALPGRKPVPSDSLVSPSDSLGGKAEVAAHRQDTGDTATDDAPARWTRATEADRWGILAASGWKGADPAKPSLSARRTVRMAWEKLEEPKRAKIAQGLAKWSANAQAAPEGAGTPAQEAPADQTRAAEGADADRAERQPVDAGARGAEVEADGVSYAQRNAARMARVEATTDEAEANAVLQEEYADDERDFDRTSKLEQAVRRVKLRASQEQEAKKDRDAYERGEWVTDQGLTSLYKRLGRGSVQANTANEKAFEEGLAAARRDNPDREYTTERVRGMSADMDFDAVRYRKKPAQATKGATPQVPVEAPKREPFEHAGLKVYPTRFKRGEQTIDGWAVQSPDNKGTDKVLGDTLHETVEAAKKDAELLARHAAERAETRAKIDAQEKAEAAEREAKKDSNRKLTVFERRANAVLDKPVSEYGKPTTRRAIIQSAVENGYAFVETKVFDSAAKKRDEAAVEAARRAGYILGASNENIPVVKAALEAQARLKAKQYDNKPEYRMYLGMKAEGPFREITKIEYDYAQRLIAEKKDTGAEKAAKPAKAQDDMLPDGWAKSENGFTKRAVFRKNQDIGQPFVVVNHVEGMAYEIEVRHGDKAVDSARVVGARSEALAKADAMLAKATETAATHQDPGQAPEAVTPAVVNESLTKAAKNEDRKPSQMKADLLRMIDEAIAKAPEEGLRAPVWKEPTKEQLRQVMVDNGFTDTQRARQMMVDSHYSRVEEAAEKVGHITFDVPGDGKFKVINDRERLADFRKKVEASAGFKDKAPAAPVSDRTKNDEAFGVERGSAGTQDAIINMLAEGDYQAAKDYADSKGLTFEDWAAIGNKLSKKDRAVLNAWVAEQREPASEPTDAGPRFEVPNPPTWNYRLKERGGSTYMVPPVGQAFTQETRRALRDWATNAGFFATITGDNEVSVAPMTGGPSLDYLVDGVKEQAYWRRANAEMAAAAEAKPWHTPLPTEGGKVTNQDRTTPSNPKSVIDGRKVVSRLAQEAMDAITRNQNENIATGGIKLTPWVLPATNDRNGVVRLLPEDQTPGAPWQQIGTEPLPLGGPRDRALWKLMERLSSAPIIASDDVAAEKATPAPVSSREGQMNLANRGSRIAALKAMNDQLRKLAPDDAWLDKNIEQADDLDALQDQISEALVKAQRGPSEANPLRAELEEMSGKELTAVFDRMGLAGARWTHSEKVEALLAEDQDAVRAAMKAIQPTTEPAKPAAKADNARRSYREPSKVSFFNPYEDGDWVKVGGQDWQVKNADGGWELRKDGDNWRTAHPTVRGHRGMNDFIAAVNALVDEAGAKAAEPAKPAAITDVGEKIGGARKDTAERGFTRGPKAEKDERPAWARRFEISQIVTPGGMLGEVKDAGRWVIRDNKSLDWTKQPKQVGRQTFATREEAEAFVPIAAVGLKHRPVPTREGKFEIWRDITDRKRVKVVDQVFDTRDEAMAYMLANAVAIVETNTTFGEADIPTPPDRQRTGAERRTGNVGDTDFKDAFGLRAVEFGNWNNQDERQALMNDAWDGLMDLADVLGLPPKALGMNGQLALAFGARGHGLQGARAHYELEKLVINLTKEKGAGSLAHEWFHALDHYFGRQDGKASAEWVVGKDGTRSIKVSDEGQAFVSHGFGYKSQVREELRTAYKALMETMFKKAETFVQDTQQADKFVGAAKQDLERALKELRAGLAEQKDPQYWKRNNKPASAEQLAEFDTIAKQMLDAEMSALDTDWKSLPNGKDKVAHRWTNDSLERLSAIYKAVRGRSGFDAEKNGVLDRLRANMGRYSQRLKMLAEAQSGDTKTRAVPTEFAMNAKELDQGRGSDYWTTPHEMAARAFQAYVEDKIAEQGGTSRFLTYGPENAGILTPWGWKRPFPAGQERVAINKAFDAFLSQIQTREDDAGNVAMFSRRSSGRGLPQRDAEAAVDLLRRELPSAPEIVLLDRVEDAPAELQATIRERGAENDVEAVYEGGVIYAFPGNFIDMDRFMFVVGRHEVRHAGFDAMLGQDKDAILMSIGRANRRVALEARKLMDDGFAASFAEGVEEALADMTAEDVAALSRIKLAVAAIRRWLRATAFKLRKAGWRALADAIEPRTWSDNDVIAFVKRAEDVSRGPGGGGGARFSRDADAAKGDSVDDEFERAAIAAGGEPAYARAFSEGRTVLTYRQWVQVRTERFKKWWGYDWESDLRGTAQGVPGAAGRAGANGVDGKAARGFPFLHERTQEPRVFFHGTRDAFTAFDIGHANKKDHGWLGVGHYVTSDEWIADTYSRAKRGSGKPQVMALFVRPNNPVELTPRKKELLARARPADVAVLTDEWRQKGHGGSMLVYEDGSIEVAVFDANGIKSASDNTGAFDPANPDIRFSRAKVSTNEDGQPEFQYGGTKLAFPIPSDRMEVIPVAGQQVLHYAIMPSDGFDVLGHVELLLENGRPVSLLDIEAYSKGGGVGRQTVETLLRALGGQSLNISNIVPAAQTFWERMGVPTQNLEEGAAYDGNIDLETFLQAQDGAGARAGSRSAGGQGRSADAGAEAGAPGTDEGSKAGRLSRASRQPLETVRDAAFRSGEAVKELNLLAGYKVGDFLASTGKLSWWDKTVGTPYNLAKRHPGTFGRVYDSVQGFLSDVSFYATEAANMAPTLLPKLESIKDLARTAIKPADNKAIAAPIFEGTLAWLRDSSGKPIRMEDAEAAAAKLSVDDKAHKLMREKRIAPEVIRMWQGRQVDQYEKMVEARYAAEFLKPGVVWTEAELRQRFGLADGQIGLYKEARAAINRSLDDLTQSELTRMVRLDLGAVAPEPGQSVDEFAVALRDRLYEMGADDTADRVIQVANRLKDLKDRGYAPLSRFGHYTLDVIHEDERVWFGLYESQAEANKAARKMAETFPGATITQGTQSQEAYKLFAGITPETIELFGDILGLDAEGDSASDKAFQEYLKRATASRSAMKRMIHRKGTAGFSEEVGRVLAGFVTSNARRTARNHAQASITQALNEIPKEQGELKDYAIKMADYVNNPVEEAQAFRGLLFAQYLGGSVASAIVNMTQPIAVGVPYLSQFGGARKAAAAMTKAMADMAGQKKLEPSLAAAIARAEEEGIVAPQEIYQLQAQASGQGGLRSGDGTVAGNALATASNAMTKASLVWGKLFSLAELVNRRSMFIAAYRVAVSNGHPNPAKFAADAVVETQFTYNKGNRPEWARGAIGAVLFTFKTYSISYVELMSRMWKLGGPDGKKAFWLGVAVLLLMGGADELPFMEDAEDVIDGVMQGVMGKNWQTKARRREFLADALGEDLARFVSRGISGLPGVPLDVSGRLGMGNLIPGTGLLRQDQSSTGRDWAEIAGPGADLIQRGFKAVGLAGQGELARAGTELLPVAARNALKAKDMADTGMYRDQTGKKVIDTTAGEAILKGIGFQPNSVARVQEASGLKQRMIALNKQTETEIADMWALGRFEGDPAKVERARNRLKDWNQQNPDSLIRIEQSQINKRVQKMRQSKAERLAATAPKEIRADVRRDLEAAK